MPAAAIMSIDRARLEPPYREDLSRYASEGDAISLETPRGGVHARPGPPARAAGWDARQPRTRLRTRRRPRSLQVAV